MKSSTAKRGAPNRKTSAQAVYISSISLENIRCFGPRQQLDLTDVKGRPAQWSVILGNNGTGKTTLLQAISLMKFREVENLKQDRSIEFSLDFPIAKHINRLEWYFSSFIRNSLESSTVGFHALIGRRLTSTRSNFTTSEFEFTSGLITTRSLSYIQPNIRHSQLLNLNIYAYGAARKAGMSSLRNVDEDATTSLFDDDSKLRNAEEWLLQYDYAASRDTKNKNLAIAQLEKIKKLLIQLLPDVDDLQFVEDNASPSIPSVEFRTPYGWVPLKELGLGYRTMITWMVDFASRMFERYPDSDEPLAEPAVVLVDEIDLHLHPKWQRSIMGYLSDLFPNTQFIVTAHSPLVVQAATDANIAVLRRKGDHVVIDQSVSAVRGWRIDQVLTSDLFELETARPPEFEQQLRERTKILSKSRLTKKDRARVAELEEEIGDLPTGERKEDIEAMEIIRRAAANMK